VVEFDSGLIKVGRTDHPRQRIRNHLGNATLHGNRVTAVWLSPAHEGFAKNEALMIEFGQREGTATRRNEYFEGLTMAQIVAYARTLDFSPPDEAKIDRARTENKDSHVWGMGISPCGRAGCAAHLLPPDNTKDFDEIALAAVGALFGRREDGAYDMPLTFASESSSDLRAVLESVARAKDVPIEDILNATWLKMFEDHLHEIVRMEALKLQRYALETGHMEILETPGDRLQQIAIVEELRNHGIID
jgi:hypothetical protein